MHLPVILSLILAAGGAAATAAGDAPLTLVRSIPLPGVEGRLDHVTVDTAGQRLFIAALGNGTVEVVDVRAGQRVRSLEGFRVPQGVLYVPDGERLVVTGAGDGVCQILDAKTFSTVASIDLKEDADNLRYDPHTHSVLVGYGNGGIGFLGPGFRLLGAAPLPAHPEAFQVSGDGARVYANVPGAQTVVVVDAARRQVQATWSLPQAGDNYPLALDETARLLFVGCRAPAELLVLDIGSGTIVQRLTLDGDCDDLWIDPARRALYASSGAGFVDVFTAARTREYRLLARVPTAAGARTSLFVPAWQQLFVAVPHRGGQRAEVRVYAVAAARP